MAASASASSSPAGDAHGSGGLKINPEDAFTIFVFGASGDLAKKKTFPSLYDLFVAELLPPRTRIVGYARSALADGAFRDTMRTHLKGGTGETVTAFLDRCFYRAGGYNDAEALRRAVAEFEPAEAADSVTGRVNRMFYFAIPPDVFTSSAATIHAAGLSSKGWNRVVIEKPFGRDSASSAALSTELSRFFSEDQLYRIDHYLGKEMVQNLMVLRFANAVFEPIWSRTHISNVQITFKEPFGTEGRGGYFDNIGIIRDVMQNHLIQVLSLVAMEAPVSMSAEDVRNEKVKVLRCVAPVTLDDIVLGQYGPNAAGTKPGYLDDTGVPKDSITPTFATAVLHINNARWRGVPFILKCGKALNERKAEIRIQFQAPPTGLFAAAGMSSRSTGVGQQTLDMEHPAHNNELVIRIQPNEAVYLKMMCKMPGLEFAPVETELNLSYKSRYPTRPPPEAYARLVLDVLRGDQSQFVRSDELEAAWGIFTPLLHQLAAERIRPVVYHFGSRGPPQSDRLVKRYGYVYEAVYGSEWRAHSEPEAARATLAEIRDEFRLPRERVLTIVNHFLGEMRRGLRGDPSTIKMIPSFVTGQPSGKEVGTVWAIDMGGSNLRVVEVHLKGDGVIERGKELKGIIPITLMSAPGSVLFDYIADQLITAGVPAGAKVAFTFSYPTAQIAVDAGTLIEWTKGFSSPGVVDMNVMDLLAAACERKGMSINLCALVNDTVGTLMMRAYSDTTCKVGVILGTGTNACYLERAAMMPKWTGPQEGNMVVNMEWGGFGSQTTFPMLPFHEVDHQLDALSPNEGKQRYEKMISGYYLGELTRLLLLRLHESGGLFVDPSASPKPHARSQLGVPWSFSTALMSAIAVDTSSDLSAVDRVLRDNFKLSSRVEDRRIVQEICAIVARRAARLAATGVAAVINQMGTDGAGITVGIDGSVFQKYPNFKAWMLELLAELGIKCALENAEDGSGMGAALVAYAALTGSALRLADLPVAMRATAKAVADAKN